MAISTAAKSADCYRIGDTDAASTSGDTAGLAP